MDEATPDVPAEICLYIRKLPTLANDHEILKGASRLVRIAPRCQCTLPEDDQRGTQRCTARRQPCHCHGGHQGRVRFEDECHDEPWSTGGILKVMLAAIACRKIRIQRRLLGLGTAHGQKKKTIASKRRC